MAVILVVLIGLWIYALSRDPLTKAKRLAEEGRTFEALTILEEYVASAPNDGPKVLELAKLQWQAEQYDKAAATFAKAASLAPNNTEAAVMAARAAARSGTATPKQLADLLERAVNLEPEDAGLWYTLALARGSAGDMPGAVEALDRVVALRPTDESAHLTLGITSALQNDRARASTEFLTVDNGPRKAEAQAGLGFVELLEGKTDEAARRLAEAVKSNELPAASAADAQLALGQMHLARGQFGDAEVALEKALESQKDNREARFLLGLCLRARGRMQDALAQFEGLMSTPGMFATEAAIQAADIQLALNAPDRAKRALDTAGRGGPKSAAYHTTQGRISLASGDEEGAMQAFETALRTDKQYAAAYLERGLLNVRREALGPGLADLDQYLKLVGDKGEWTRVEEVRALADQLRQAAQGPAAAEGEA